MATVISGARQTAGSDGILAVKRIIDMADRILLLEPNANVLTTLLARLDRESVFNPEFKVLKDELQPIVDAINSASGYTASDATLKVDNVSYFQANQLILFPRVDEVAHVTATSATDSTITVTRDVAGAVTEGALNDDEPIYILSSAAKENADVGTPLTVKQTSDTNYTQYWVAY